MGFWGKTRFLPVQKFIARLASIHASPQYLIFTRLEFALNSPWQASVFVNSPWRADVLARRATQFLSVDFRAWIVVMGEMSCMVERGSCRFMTWTLGVFTMNTWMVIMIEMGKERENMGHGGNLSIIPHCCKKRSNNYVFTPYTTPYNQQSASYFKGSELISWAQDPTNAVSGLQVDRIGINQIIITVPQKFTLKTLELGNTREQTNL
ncbi:COBRA-like protein [Medicago truncatula]|uniref:COBRA-like protein n=1 Tax=Medicago truncatula TaxID=3880 RepID=G7IT20_MEDTR|nr:COBRA-like protein [Medicago truncatula]